MKIFKKISILSLTAIGALLVVSCSSNSNSSNESSNTTGDSNSQMANYLMRLVKI